jgi:hypothetical protein
MFEERKKAKVGQLKIENITELLAMHLVYNQMVIFYHCHILMLKCLS